MSTQRTRDERVDALRGVVERHDEAPTPALSLGAAEVLGLQRTAGNAAVTRMIQRQLHVRHGGHVERFKRSREAARYLTDKYTEKYAKPPGDKASDRIETLAKDADLDNEITRTWLADALEHIHTGSRLKRERGYIDPSKSPKHKPMPDRVEYMMGAGQPPSRMQAPGSPRADLADEYLDVDGEMGRLFGALGPKRARMAESAKKNLYAYNVRAKYRIHELAVLPDGGGFIEAGPPAMHEAVASSATYQSAFTLYEGGADVEGAMRTRLDGLLTDAKARPTKKKSAFRDSPAGKFSKSDGDGGYAFGGAAQPYAHSETQADSQVGTEGPRIAKELLDQMIRQAPAHRPVGIVVQSQILVGASEIHTVCGGACKHALCHISKQIEAELTKARHAYKDAYAPMGIHIRGSEELTTSSHVQGRQKFKSGFMKINGEQLATGAAAHGRVVEYQPRTAS